MPAIDISSTGTCNETFRKWAYFSTYEIIAFRFRKLLRSCFMKITDMFNIIMSYDMWFLHFCKLREILFTTIKHLTMADDLLVFSCYDIIVDKIVIPLAAIEKAHLRLLPFTLKQRAWNIISRTWQMIDGNNNVFPYLMYACINTLLKLYIYYIYILFYHQVVPNSVFF